MEAAGAVSPTGSKSGIPWTKPWDRHSSLLTPNNARLNAEIEPTEPANDICFFMQVV
jgi:hypothetical protein